MDSHQLQIVINILHLAAHMQSNTLAGYERWAKYGIITKYAHLRKLLSKSKCWIQSGPFGLCFYSTKIDQKKKKNPTPLLISLYAKCSITYTLKPHCCTKNLMVNCISVSSQKIWFSFICFLQWPLMLSLHVIMTFPPQQERDQKSMRSHREFVCLGSRDLYISTRSAHAEVQFAEMYVVCTAGLSHTGTLRRTPKWILNHGVSTGKKKKMDYAPRKFNFQCQIASFPQLLLLSKNQQCLWTADNIKRYIWRSKNTRKHLFLLLNKNKQHKAESWAEKSFSDTVNVLFITQACPYDLISCWWADESVAATCCKYTAVAEGAVPVPRESFMKRQEWDLWRHSRSECVSTGVTAVCDSPYPGKARLDPSARQTRALGKADRGHQGQHVSHRAPILAGLWGKIKTRRAPASEGSCCILNFGGVFPSAQRSTSAWLP